MKGMKIAPRWRAVLLGVGVGTVAMVSACAAAAGAMAAGTADPELMGYWAAGILVGSSLVGSLAALLGGGGPADAVLVVVGELMVLAGLNVGLNGGEMERIAVTILALSGGCGAAVLLRMGRRNRRKRHH